MTMPILSGLSKRPGPVRFFIVSASGENWVFGEEELFRVRARIARKSEKRKVDWQYYTMLDDLEVRRIINMEHLSDAPNLICLPANRATHFLSNTKYALVEWYLD